jgi:hypothetical protein
MKGFFMPVLPYMQRHPQKKGYLALNDHCKLRIEEKKSPPSGGLFFLETFGSAVCTTSAVHLANLLVLLFR